MFTKIVSSPRILKWDNVLRFHGLFERMIRENLYSLLAEHDIEFHVAVIELAQNRAATEMYRDVLQKLILGNGGWQIEGASLTCVLNEHEKIIEALTIRDIDYLLKVADFHLPWVAQIPRAVREKMICIRFRHTTPQNASSQYHSINPPPTTERKSTFTKFIPLLRSSSSPGILQEAQRIHILNSDALPSPYRGYIVAR